MDARGGLGRGVRVGLLTAGVPGGLWATFACGAGIASLAQGNTGGALSALLHGGELVIGSAAAGVLMGTAVGGGLALASPRTAVTGVRRLALVSALLAAVTFPAEVLVVALGTGAGPLETVVTLLAWPVAVVVAARHSTDIAGRTRDHPWLWSEGRWLSARRRWQRQPSQP